MKIASITLPQRARGHDSIAETLLDWCNGYTRLTISGGWRLANGLPIVEDGYRYEFTSPNTKTARDELVALAYRIKTISDEEAIFIVHANGNTEIVR